MCARQLPEGPRVLCDRALLLPTPLLPQALELLRAHLEERTPAAFSKSKTAADLRAEEERAAGAAASASAKPKYVKQVERVSKSKYVALPSVVVDGVLSQLLCDAMFAGPHGAACACAV